MTSVEVPYSIASALPSLTVLDITNEIRRELSRSGHDSGIAYVAPLAAIGAVIAGYHILVEHHVFEDSLQCSAAAPCTFVWFKELGFVTLPVMALAGFLFVIALLAPAPQETVPDATRQEASTPAQVVHMTKGLVSSASSLVSKELLGTLSKHLEGGQNIAITNYDRNA